MPITTTWTAPNDIDESPWSNHGYVYEGRHDSVQLQFGGLELAVAKNNGANTVSNAWTRQRAMLPLMRSIP